MFDSERPLSLSYKEQCDTNRAKIEAAYSASFAEILRFIDAQYELLRLTAWTGHSDELSRRGPAQTILYSVLYKNAFLFFSVVDLVRIGLYGPAGTLLRPVLEGLVCAKYCALTNDDAVFNTWRGGHHVSLTRQVLSRIESPSIDEVRILWEGLNKMAHASIYAQQLASKYEDIRQEVHGILAITRMLLALNYHLLTRQFITPTTIYYTSRYGDDRALQAARQHARTVAADFRSSFGKDGKKFLRESCARWQLKPARQARSGDLTNASSGRARAAEA